jgi:hypothetical protein
MMITVEQTSHETKKENVMRTDQYHQFQHLRRNSGLQSRAVANAAGVSLREEYLFEIGGVIPIATKEKIVAAFSALTNHPYILADFEAVLLASDEAVSREETVALQTLSPAPAPKGANHGKQHLH